LASWLAAYLHPHSAIWSMRAASARRAAWRVRALRSALVWAT
jgi:hypothetical protein